MARSVGSRILTVVGCVIAVVFVCEAKGNAPLLGQGRHEREYWKQIAKNHYAVPAGQEVWPLVRELSGYLGSPDPELRDDLAYSLLEVWIGRQKQLSSEQLLTLLEEWQANLRAGIGETGGDGVFRRSFSALCLATLAERELRDPFLGENRFRTLLSRALEYLNEERDLRGFDAKKGWIHATAHTADLLAALAENRHLTREDQGRMLQGIKQRLATAEDIFQYGEPDRLANVAAAIIAREDFDAARWPSWVAGMDEEDGVVWHDSPPKLQLLARFENDSYFLRATVAQISLRTASSASAEAQKVVCASLRRR